MINNSIIEKDLAIKLIEEIQKDKTYDMNIDQFSFLFKNSLINTEIEFEKIIQQLESQYKKQMELLYYLALNSTNKLNILKYSNLFFKNETPRLSVDYIVLNQLRDTPKKVYINQLIFLLLQWSEFCGKPLSIDYIKQWISKIDYKDIFDLFKQLRSFIFNQTIGDSQTGKHFLMIPINLDDQIVLKQNGEIVKTKMMNNIVLTTKNQVYFPKQNAFKLQGLTDNPYLYQGELNIYGQYIEGLGSLVDIKLQNTRLDGQFYKGQAQGLCRINSLHYQGQIEYYQGQQLNNQRPQSVSSTGYSYQQNCISQSMMVSLDFGRWINQKMIDIYISYRFNELLLTQNNYLKQKFINFVITPSEFQDVFSSQLSKNSPPNVSEWMNIFPSLCQKMNLNFEDCRSKIRFIFTICHERSHFILIVGEGSSLYLIDSFDTISNPHQFLENFNQQLNYIPHFTNQYCYYYLLHTTKQINGYDCGIHCILNAMKIIRSPHISVRDIDFSEQLSSKQERFNLQNFFYNQ